MPPRRRLSNIDRGRALAWLHEGIAVREVARRLAVSHSVIIRLRDRVAATGTAVERRRSGRPRCTTRREDRAIARTALATRTCTARHIRQQVVPPGNVGISDQTIRNRLREIGLRSRRPAVRVPLTQAHRIARRTWSAQHLRWTRLQWSTVLFTDESRFTLSFNDGRIRVWRRPGERFHDDCVQEYDRYGGGSVMVWGGIGLNHRTPLHRIQGTLTGIRYRDEILRPIAIPALQAMGQGAILQDDNARPHRARVVDDFLQQQHVIRLDWPARSPDLSPIEHLWDALGRRVRDHQPPPNNVDELFNILDQGWQAIPQLTLRTLIQSMRQRCNDCFLANGGHTRF